ncbi:MAG: hypothetical protein KJ063_03910 [Anaerolineae bacterium]|nr:hypothetical protein [Anaerolineae bacterium]
MSLFAEEAAVLRQLLRLTLSADHVAVRQQVEQRKISGLSPAYFLLAMDKYGGTEHFVTYQLGRIVQQLSRYTEQREVEYSGQVRGRILWSATLKARHSGQPGPHRFICRQVNRRYDTLENQLVKYIIEAIYQALHTIPPIIREGVSYFPADGYLAPTYTALRLRRMETAINSLRYHVRLREITLPTAISGEHWHAAANARLEEYGEVVQVYQLYHSLCLQPQWEQFVQIGQRGLPLPGSLLGEGESWVQVAAAILHS